MVSGASGRSKLTSVLAASSLEWVLCSLDWTSCDGTICGRTSCSETLRFLLEFSTWIGMRTVPGEPGSALIPTGRSYPIAGAVPSAGQVEPAEQGVWMVPVLTAFGPDEPVVWTVSARGREFLRIVPSGWYRSTANPQWWIDSEQGL